MPKGFTVNFSYFMMYYFIASSYISGANEEFMKLQNSVGVS